MSIQPDFERLEEIAARWRRVSHAHAHGPNRPRIERAIVRAYELADLRAPRVVTWVRSPLAGARRVLRAAGGTGHPDLGAPVAGAVSDTLFDTIWDAAAARLTLAGLDTLRSIIDRGAWAPDRSAPWLVTEADIDAQTGETIDSWGRAALTGHSTQYQSAWIECFAQLGVPEADSWPLAPLGEAGCWAWTFENTAIVAEPPG